MQHELGSMSVLADPLRKHVRLDHDAEAQAASCCVSIFSFLHKDENITFARVTLLQVLFQLLAHRLYLRRCYHPIVATIVIDKM